MDQVTYRAEINVGKSIKKYEEKIELESCHCDLDRLPEVTHFNIVFEQVKYTSI